MCVWCVCGVCVVCVCGVCMCVGVCGVCVWCVCMVCVMYVQKERNPKSRVMNILHCCKAHKCEAWNHGSTYIRLADQWENDNIW